VAVDWLRVAWDMTVVGFLNVVLVWLAVHQLGYFDAEDRIPPAGGVLLAASGLAALTLLVSVGGYPVRMVGVPGDDVSNAYPPNLAMLSLAMFQIGVVLALRRPLARLLRSPRLWFAVATVNMVIMSLYLWHQVAHIATAAILLPSGYPTPAAGSGAWWAATLGMVACSAAVLVGIVALVRPAEHRRPPADEPAGRAASVLSGIAIPLAALGLLFIAGTPVTLLHRSTEVLGPIPGSPLLGLALLLCAVGLLRAARLTGGGRPWAPAQPSPVTTSPSS
jgi:hypothetical protein